MESTASGGVTDFGLSSYGMLLNSWNPRQLEVRICRIVSQVRFLFCIQSITPVDALVVAYDTLLQMLFTSISLAVQCSIHQRAGTLI